MTLFTKFSGRIGDWLKQFYNDKGEPIVYFEMPEKKSSDIIVMQFKKPKHYALWEELCSTNDIPMDAKGISHIISTKEANYYLDRYNKRKRRRFKPFKTPIYIDFTNHIAFEGTTTQLRELAYKRQDYICLSSMLENEPKENW